MIFNLTPRQKSILMAVIEDYIMTGEPVGSRTIAKKYSLGLSPATIRNEMSELEELGLLEQPHLSAGRIPSERGYRSFVDFLMDNKTLEDSEIEMIRNINTKIMNLDNILEQSSKILSAILDSVSFIQFPEVNKEYIKHFQVLPINQNAFLIIIVSNTGKVSDYIIKTDSPVSEEYFERVSNYLNKNLKDTPLSEVNKKLRKLINNNDTDDLFINIYNSISNIILENKSSKIKITGTSNLLKSPEFNQKEKAQSLINLLENDDISSKLSEIFGSIESSEPIVLIGHEIKIAELKDCSLVLGTYNLNGNIYGNIGLLGPLRMDYAKSVAVVKEMSSYLNNLLSKLYGIE
jgi:heat-inducible transcriptional repressor